MLLDLDVGPLLLTQKLLDSVIFARAKGYARPLTAAELEMMNLTGDGNGFDDLAIGAPSRMLSPSAFVGAVAVVYGQLFLDGFESADPYEWSAVAP